MKSEADFWAQVDRDAHSCWTWRGYLNDQGYGRVRYQGVRYLAHRLAYELVKGPIPADLVLDHLCACTDCVNPDHLEAVPSGVNTARGRYVNWNRQKTECKHGHPFNERNTAYRANGQRYCRACNVQNVMRIKRKKRTLVAHA